MLYQVPGVGRKKTQSLRGMREAGSAALRHMWGALGDQGVWRCARGVAGLLRNSRLNLKGRAEF